MPTKGQDWYRNTFLQSDKWRDFREIILREFVFCTRCGQPACDLHHWRYPDDIWKMSKDDVVPLCRRCHSRVHDMIRTGVIPGPGSTRREDRPIIVRIIEDDNMKIQPPEGTVRANQALQDFFDGSSEYFRYKILKALETTRKQLEGRLFTTRQIERVRRIYRDRI